jgi:cytochrome c
LIPVLTKKYLLILTALISLLAVAGCESGEKPAAPAESADVAAAPAAETADAGYKFDELVAGADLKRGKTLFLQCRACHSLGEGEAHKVGPNLYGVFGRNAGLAPGFAYSEAVTAADISWSPETLDEWLARPSDFLPGNRMVFIGVKDPQDRANLIAYLQQETGAAP